MRIKQVLLSVVGSVLLLTACGGGSGGGNDGSSSSDSPGEGQVNKKYDIFSYMSRKKTAGETEQEREFILKRFYYEDGTPAWFNRFGMSTSAPVTDEEKSQAFNTLKTGKIVFEFDGGQKIVEAFYSRFRPYDTGEFGPFFVGDHGILELHAGSVGFPENTVSLGRGNIYNQQLDDLSILDKYNWTIPRYIENYATIDLDQSNSYLTPKNNTSFLDLNSESLDRRTSSYESCQFEFKEGINIHNSVTKLAPSKLYKDVMVTTCHLFPAGSNSSVGYKITYYAKNIGEIHRVTSLGQGVVHHVIETRQLYPFPYTQ